MADVELLEVRSHRRPQLSAPTLRVGDVFLKIDVDQTRIDVEVEAMALAPIPTPKVLWRKPPVLALAALPVDDPWPFPLPSTASAAAWAAAGAAAWLPDDAPLPPWPGKSLDQIAARLDREVRVARSPIAVLPTDLVTRNRRVAAGCPPAVDPGVHPRRPASPRRVHLAGDDITGVI